MNLFPESQIPRLAPWANFRDYLYEIPKACLVSDMTIVRWRMNLATYDYLRSTFSSNPASPIERIWGSPVLLDETLCDGVIVADIMASQTITFGPANDADMTEADFADAIERAQATAAALGEAARKACNP
jgi:hypothetical protein